MRCGSGTIGQRLTPAAPEPVALDVAAGTIPDLPPADHPELYRSSTHGFVDYSEDIKSSDLVSAVREGYDLMELDKRYTTVTMGPIQGKPQSLATPWPCTLRRPGNQSPRRAPRRGGRHTPP